MADYFTLVEFRASLPDMSDTVTYTDAKIEAAAADFTATVDREVFGNTGLGFIPRSFTATLDGHDRTVLVPPHTDIRSLTSVTVGGVAVATSLLTYINGTLRYLDETTWAKGVANVVATYSAGKYATCPGDVKEAVMWATRDQLISQASANGIDVRKTSMTNDLGGTISYILPGEKRPTGYPKLDAVIASYARATPSYGFA